MILIVGTQALGVVCECALIHRLVKRNIMPKKELIVLALALLIEVVRMFLVDVVVLKDYFNGVPYYVHRQPLLCDESDADAWLGADSLWYCPDHSARTDDTHYYLAYDPYVYVGGGGGGGCRAPRRSQPTNAADHDLVCLSTASLSSSPSFAPPTKPYPHQYNHHRGHHHPPQVLV